MFVTEGELRGRVRYGAAFLDEHDPDWQSRITRPIRVANTHECPLAQLYGRYRDGVERYELNEEQTLTFGFRADSKEVGGTHRSVREYYDLLDVQWKIELEGGE